MYEGGEYKQPVLYRGEHVGKEIVRRMKSEALAFPKIYQKFEPITDEDKKQFEVSVNCQSGEALNIDSVRDHDYITENAEGSTLHVNSSFK